MQLANIRHRLCECLGLSEYEARVYVSLIGAGSAKARTLSMTSGVPRTKVYSVLKKLTETGLVAEVPGEPREFAAKPPRSAFGSYLHSYQSMLGNLVSLVSSLEEISKSTADEVMPQQGTIWIINGRQEILRKIREMLSKARRSVHLATDREGIILLYRTFNRLFDDLTERSVAVKITTPNDTANLHMLNELRYTCKVEEVDLQLPLTFLHVDRKQLLLAILRPDESPEAGINKAVFLEEPVLRDMLCLLIPERAGAPTFHSTPSRMEISDQEQHVSP